MATPRQGPSSRMSRYREATWGVDPAAPASTLIPFISDGFALRQPRARGQFYDGVNSAKGSYLEPITSAGPLGTSLDYWALGNDLADVLGIDTYSRQGGLHVWRGPGNPLPHGIRREFLQAPAIVHRYPGTIAGSISFAQATRGQQQYTVQRVSQGTEKLTDIGGTTLVDNTEKKVNSYFNGVLIQDGTTLGFTTVFDVNVDRHVTPKDGLFSGGAMSAYSVGVTEIRGTLGKAFTTDDGDTFYLQAVNETVSALTCVYANKPSTGAATKWLALIFPEVLFDRMAPAAGGDTIPDQNQTWFAQTPATAYLPAHATGTLTGTYNITAADNVVSLKPEGGATVNVTLTNGSARTTDQIVTELMADGGFNAKFKVTNFLNRLRIESLDATTNSSVQWQTATANSAHSKLGFDATTWTGYAPKEMYVELYNGTTSDYT